MTGRWFPDFCFFVTAEGTGEKGRREKKNRQKVACSFPCSSLPPFPLEWKKRIAEGEARKEKSYSDLSVQKQGGTAREVLLFFVHFRVLFFFFEKVVVCFSRFSSLFLLALLLSRDVLRVVRRGQGLLRGLVVLGTAEEHNLFFVSKEGKEEKEGKQFFILSS